MEYRILPHGGEKISVIGLGGASLPEAENELVPLLDAAIENGVNYFDLAPSVRQPFFAFAKAFAGRRPQIITQMHFGAIYKSGKYGWTRKLDDIREQFDWELKLLNTNYTDIGFIHCTDDMDDLDEVMRTGGMWDYMKALKGDGKIRHLGFSSHNPDVAHRILDTGLIDMMMFSINPAYDYRKGEYAIGEVAQRAELYRKCQSMGVGISVMKPFAGGQLLDSKTSLFGHALTHTQCIHYALERPAVVSVLPGVRNMEDLQTVLSYNSATPQQKDYSVIGKFTPQEAQGICVYCNHCQPCPKGLDVGLINKYYDLAVVGDEMAKGHYWKLPIRADSCAECGHCESRCPFHVKQESRMKEIASYFEKNR